MHKCTKAQMHKCANAQMHKRTHAKIHKGNLRLWDKKGGEVDAEERRKPTKKNTTCSLDVATLRFQPPPSFSVERTADECP